MDPTSAKRIRPVALRRVIGQQIQSIDLDQDALLVRTRDHAIHIDAHTASVEYVSSWLVLKRLTLLSSIGKFVLDGVTPESVEAISNVILEAQRRHGILTRLRSNASSVNSAVAAWDALYDRDEYLTFGKVERWKSIVASAPETSTITAADADLIDKLPEESARALRRFLTIAADPKRAAEQRNAGYILQQLCEHETFLDSVESQPLTEQQRQAVVHDEDAALVIAGAGTGKTSTIVAKVGFILRKGWARPEEILLLAFTRDAAQEMRERLHKRLGVDLTVQTFHALGMEIIARATGKKPSVCPEASDNALKARTLQNILTGLLAGDDSFRRDYLLFKSRLSRPYRPAWEFATEAEYRDYLLDVETRALAGMRVRSYEECEIANWLTVSGVRFEYERAYEVETATPDHRQYRPDFFLPDHGIYIEHWGVNRQDRTAPFVDGEKYREKMRWAREKHAQHGTKLVETFSWEKQEGILLSCLEEKLREQGVVFAPISIERALALLNEAGRADPLVGVIGTFLSHYKSAGLRPEDVARRAGHSGGDRERDLLFLRLFGRVYAAYEELLRGRGEIDFDDMIVAARGHVEAGRFRSPYRYLLVDEFQDIADGRAALLRALRGQAADGSGVKLFCVGDDWQSIYRFSGSNIALTTEFEQHFGPARRTALDRTFRFHDTLAAFSSRFVQKNPGQIRKDLTTAATSQMPGVTVYLGGDGNGGDALNWALADISERVAADGRTSASVLILGRYGFTLPKPDALRALGAAFPRLSLRAMTAHASKGLEADYVVLADVKRGKYGFPSEVADDPVLAMVLPEAERFPFAEERRLFYVALTRARRHVCVLADATNLSPFVREVVEDVGYVRTVIAARVSASAICPVCRRAEVRRKTGEFGEFFSCSNYPVCSFKGTDCPRCERDWMRRGGDGTARCGSCGFLARVCPRCGSGVLRERRGRYGSFWGCSNYGRRAEVCEYTEKIAGATAERT